MLGVMLTEKEVEEIAYLLKRELEEILSDLSDNRLEPIVQVAMKEKYGLVYGLYKRFTRPEEWSQYALSSNLLNKTPFDKKG
ncbi:hypothetical protein [Shouchella lonarensis]|uniref:Uncharacterized protein n=1 Tax=Shouchella lonarensis TaxID=1464122 RepID=A0A1G6P7D3_9BACI|nr:hypothetical protein [Shouchella lonarensis]SDC75999.1 hypothetical protein SAMN05421737_11533 [Shouchella lonarensis]